MDSCNKVDRLFLIGLVVLIQINISSAQKSMYFKLGQNFNTQTENKFSVDKLQTGGFLSCGLSTNLNQWFGSSLEASFIQKSSEWLQDSILVNDVNQFIDIGFSFRARKEFKSSMVCMTGGMLLSFWQSGQRYQEDGNKSEEISLNYANARSALDIGMYLGLEYGWKSVFIEMRLNQGLVDISNEKYDLNSIYNSSVSVGLGYRIKWD